MKGVRALARAVDVAASSVWPKPRTSVVPGDSAMPPPPPVGPEFLTDMGGAAPAVGTSTVVVTSPFDAFWSLLVSAWAELSWVSPSLGWPAKPLSVAGNGLLAARAMYVGVAKVRLTASVKELVL